MDYARKATKVAATQWKLPGDHPAVNKTCQLFQKGASTHCICELI
jgi:hypothetical protein